MEHSSMIAGEATASKTAEASKTSEASTTAEQFFGLMRLGGALVALPVAAIREVIPGQPTYSPLPVKAEGLLGSVDIRGAIIPVLDLAVSLGLPASGNPQHVIVIMRWDGKLLGLKACEVCGIARLKETDLFTLSTNSPTRSASLATHTFQTGGEIATLLDAKGIADLPDIPLVAEKVVSRNSEQASTTESILLFTQGRSHFGIDATCVDATVPAIQIERCALTAGFCLGVIDHHGYDVPVVNTTAAVGLGTGALSPETPVIVVRFEAEAMLGFAIDQVRDITRVTRTDTLAMPALAMGDVPLFKGILSGADGRQNLLFDIDNLRVHPVLLALARLRKPRISLVCDNAGPNTGRGTPSNGRKLPYLTYVACGEHATSLNQVSEILNYPTDVAPFDLNGVGMLGLFTHRGKVAPLVCMGTLIGRTPNIDQATARVLFVEHAGNAVGFVVEGLRSIEMANWRSPATGADGTSGGSSIFKSLVMLGLGAQRRMVSHIDLIAEIGRLYPHAGPMTLPEPGVAPRLQETALLAASA